MEAPLTPAQQARSLVPFVTVTLIWSSTWLVITGQLGHVPPSWSVTYRFLVAGIAMVAYVLVRRESLWLTPRQIGLAALVGAFQFAINFNMLYRAEQYIASGLVALLFALLIVPNAVLARVFLKQQVSLRFLIGSVIAIGGVAILFAHEIEGRGVDAGTVAMGVGLTLVSVLSASIANVMQAAPAVRAAPLAPMLSWSMLIGTAGCAAYAWATTGAPVFDWRPSYVLGVLYLGVAASTLTFPLYFGVIRAIGPARAAYSSVLIPIVAMALSTVFEGYRWSFQSGLGCVLTLAGLVVALRARSPAA